MNTLATLLAQPEGRTLEFKRHGETRTAMRSIVAFANTAGGTLLLGVDDDGTPRGLPDVRAAEEAFANAIADSIEPPLSVDLEIHSHEGKDLLAVRVPRFPGPFYLHAEGPDEGVYIRSGSTDRPAPQAKREELRRLAQAQSYDERPCLGAILADLDRGAIDAAFEPAGRVPDEAKLETLGLVSHHGSQRVPTNGGILLFGTASARARFFPDGNFRCARFLGTSKATFLDRLDPEASVLGALDEVERFVRRNTRLAARIESLRREDVPEYSTIALREVLANAVAHADYSLRGMPIRVAIYDDRMEVENPGGWPVGFTEEDFRAGVSRVRNPVVARVMHELDLVERWGSGYRRIREACEAGGYPMPKWHETGPVLRVRFMPHPEVSKVGATASPPDISPRRQDRLAWIRKQQQQAGQTVSAKEIAERFGVSERTAYRDLKDIATLSTAMTGDSDADNGSDSDSDREADRSERQRWFLNELARGADRSASDIMTQFGVSERTARRDLAGLQAQNLIAFRGAPKTGRYVLPQEGSDPDAL